MPQAIILEVMQRQRRLTLSQSKVARGAAPASRTLRSEFLTPTEVADRLLIAPVTVRLWASKGLLPSVTTPGGHRRFRTADVEAFMAKRMDLDPVGRGPLRVLIIDDDPQFARYLSKLMTKVASAIFVDIATDGFSAGIKCEAMRPDALTLDLQMPDMDGFEVCQMIRAQFGRQKPRIVALTGFPSEENKLRIIEAGADSCLSKTVPPETLLRELGIAAGNKPKAAAP
jgi:excisionase family DNA binding protein